MQLQKLRPFVIKYETDQLLTYVVLTNIKLFKNFSNYIFDDTKNKVQNDNDNNHSNNEQKLFMQILVNPKD